MQYDTLYFIGRFQPFHNGHMHVIRKALQMSENVVVLIGSAGGARKTSNPFTYEERSNFILDAFKEEAPGRILTLPLFDVKYNDTAWIKQIHRLTSPNRRMRVGIIGAEKDNTSYYLNILKDFSVEKIEINEGISSTDIRELVFMYDDQDTYEEVCSMCPDNVVEYIYNHMPKSDFEYMVDEFATRDEYRTMWSDTPYPVKQLTVDSVVEQSGHVLLVQRKQAPGKGLWALPGGHLEVTETVLDGAIRELREETRLKVPVPVLKGSLVAREIFDDPRRSDVGRVVTHAHHFKLRDDMDFPQVKGGDDADKAKWVRLADIREDMMHDDHFHIINYFTRGY